MTTKHTPAPWQLLNDFGSFKILQSKGSSIELARVFPKGEEIEDFDVAVANAKIITAAPDLLEALIDLLSIAEVPIFRAAHPSELLKAHAAIAKATQ